MVTIITPELPQRTFTYILICSVRTLVKGKVAATIAFASTRLCGVFSFFVITGIFGTC